MLGAGSHARTEIGDDHNLLEYDDESRRLDLDTRGAVPNSGNLDESADSSDLKRQKVTGGNDFARDVPDPTEVIDESISQQPAPKGRITRFAQPRYPMFETRDMHAPFTDYGRGVEHLQLHHLSTSSSRFVFLTLY